jgi:drug/metabolite transporter (DMT)-like permease
MKSGHRWPMKWRVATAFAAVGVIWGSAWIPTASLAQEMPALTSGVLRFALAAMVVGLAALVFRRRGGSGGTDALLLPAAVLGVTMLGLPYALTVWAAGRVSPGLVALLFGLMPLLVALFEAENRAALIPALVLGIGGVAMVAAPGLSFHWSQSGGAAALLAAVALGGFSLVYARRLYRQQRIGPGRILAFSAIQLAFASLFLLVLMASIRQKSSLYVDGSAVLPLGILAIVVSGGTLPLIYWLLARAAAWQIATLQWVVTLVAVSEAAVVVHARPDAEAWIGAALIPVCILWIFFRADAESLPPVTLKITSDPFPQPTASDIHGKSG